MTLLPYQVKFWGTRVRISTYEFGEETQLDPSQNPAYTLSGPPSKAASRVYYSVDIAGNERWAVLRGTAGQMWVGARLPEVVAQSHPPWFKEGR